MECPVGEAEAVLPQYLASCFLEEHVELPNEEYSGDKVASDMAIAE